MVKRVQEGGGSGGPALIKHDGGGLMRAEADGESGLP